MIEIDPEAVTVNYDFIALADFVAAAGAPKLAIEDVQKVSVVPRPISSAL